MGLHRPTSSQTGYSRSHHLRVLQLKSGGWFNVGQPSNCRLHGPPLPRYSSIPGPCSAFGEALAGWVNASEAFASMSAAMNANAIFFNIAVILLCSGPGHSLSLHHIGVRSDPISRRNLKE